MMELLISWCVTSSILLAVFLLLRGTVFRTLSPRVRYALWGVVLLRLLVPFQIPSLSLPASAADLAPELPVLSNRPLSPDTATGHAVIPSDLLEENGLTIADDGTVQASPSDQDAALWELQENGEVYLYFGGPTLDDVLRAAVALAWGAGAGVVLLAVLAANLRFAQKLRRSRRPLPTAGCPLPVYEADVLSSPCLCGVLHPAVYLTPEAAEDGTVRTHVLSHELTHFRHRDHIWSLLRCLALALHWYNPLVWAAMVLSKQDGELACDEGTIRRLGEGERIPYGRTLIGLVARRSGAGGVLSCSTTMTGGKKTVQRRITQLVKQPETKKTALFLAAAALALAAVFVFAGGQRDPEPSPSDDGYLSLKSALRTAQAIRLGQPLDSSGADPDSPRITDPDLLSQAKDLLDHVYGLLNYSDEMLELDWPSIFAQSSPLTLWADPENETDFNTHTFYLWWDAAAGETYLMDVDPEHFTEESCLPFAVFEGNLPEQLEALQQVQRQRVDQPEQTSGFSPEGLLFSSSGDNFDQVAQDFGAALSQAYLDLPADAPKAVVFAQTDAWEITQTLPEDGDRFCVRLSLVVQPLSPNTVHWMSGGGLDLTEDGRWLDTHEYRLERVEGDTWICAEYGGSVGLPEEDTAVSNAGEQILSTTASLQGEDIQQIFYAGGPVPDGWAEDLDREELARLIRQAAGQPQAPITDRQDDEGALDHRLWTLELRLTDGTILDLYAGRVEDQITLLETLHLTNCPELYDLIRHVSDDTQQILVTDPDILAIMDQVMADTLAQWRTPEYAGEFIDNCLDAQLTALYSPGPAEPLREHVELYVYDYGLVMEDLFNAPWAGGPYVDSQLRYHPYSLTQYLAVERAADGTISRWGTFFHEFAPPLDQWDEEVWSIFSDSVEYALDQGGVQN